MDGWYCKYCPACGYKIPQTEDEYVQEHAKSYPRAYIRVVKPVDDEPNPFLVRRLRWLDGQGRKCSTIVPAKDVDEEVKKLTEAGVATVEIDKIQWTPEKIIGTVAVEYREP